MKQDTVDSCRVTPLSITSIRLIIIIIIIIIITLRLTPFFIIIQSKAYMDGKGNLLLTSSQTGRALFLRVSK
jgi:hypothetical protein